MDAKDLIAMGLQASRGIWERALRGSPSPDEPVPELPREQLVWRPAPGSHSIGRLLWHIAEVEDRWLREFLQEESFEPRFGRGSLDDTSDASIPQWSDLMAYVKETRARTLESLPQWVDRLAEPRSFYGRPSTVGRILMTMITHEAGHAGQIAHVMGLIRRAGW